MPTAIQIHIQVVVQGLLERQRLAVAKDRGRPQENIAAILLSLFHYVQVFYYFLSLIFSLHFFHFFVVLFLVLFFLIIFMCLL